MEFDMKKVRVGDVVKGTVAHVTDNEAYVDIQSFYEGVIYKEGLTLDKNVTSVKDLLQEGQELEFKVNSVDNEHQRALLSRLDMLKDEKRTKFAEATKDQQPFTVKVKRVNTGGLTVTHDGIDMFMPASQIDVKRVNPEDFKGQTLECVVIENKNNKIVVSRRKVLEAHEKATKKAAYDAIEINSTVEGVVSNLVKYGAFIQLGDVEGLLHISEMSHHRIEQPSEVLNAGDTVTVKVIAKEKGRISLSLRALQKTPWDEFAETHNVGDEVEGTIVRKMAKGMLVEITRDVVGMISSKDYSWNPRENLAGQVEVGDKLTLKIVSLDVKKRRMGLSKKHLEYNPWADVSVKRGEEVSGTVVELQSGGALVQVQNVNGYLPISEISAERINQVSDVLKLEQVINALVLEVDKSNWKLKLSIKALKHRKEREMFEKYKETEEEVQKPTLGELFKEKFDELKEDEE